MKFNVFLLIVAGFFGRKEGAQDSYGSFYNVNYGSFSGYTSLEDSYVRPKKNAYTERYLNPYNYVRYEIGGSKPSKYNYQFSTQQLQKNLDPSSPFVNNQYQQYNSYPKSSQSYYEEPSYNSHVNLVTSTNYHPYQYVNSNSYKDVEDMSPVQTHTSSYNPTLPQTSPAPRIYHSTISPLSYSTPSPVFFQSSPSPSYPSTTPAPKSTHYVAMVSSDNVKGEVHFYQASDNSPVRVLANITGLSPGLHGFHIHNLGDITGGCKSTGGHFNPSKATHGGPDDLQRHAGDLGNIMCGPNGEAVMDKMDSGISLSGENNILGRGVVIHAGQDDLGRGGDDGSLKTGNAGGRVACGVIGRAAAGEAV